MKKQALEIQVMARMTASEVARIEEWGRARGYNRSAALRALAARGLDAARLEAATREAIADATTRAITHALYAVLPALLVRTAGGAAGAPAAEVAARIRDQQSQIRRWIVEAGIPEANLLPPEPGA